MFILKKKKFSLAFIAFLQVLGLVFYCCLVGVLFWQGNTWFGPMLSFLDPTLFMILFVASALISGILILGYPIILFWKKKTNRRSFKIGFLYYSLANFLHFSSRSLPLNPLTCFLANGGLSVEK